MTVVIADPTALAKLSAELVRLIEVLTIEEKERGKLCFKVTIERKPEEDGYCGVWCEVPFNDDNPVFEAIKTLLANRALAIEGEILDMLTTKK